MRRIFLIVCAIIFFSADLSLPETTISVNPHNADFTAHPGIDLVKYSEACVTMGTNTTPSYDLATGSCYIDTIDTGETTATFSNPATSGKLSNVTLILVNGGSQIFHWPASVRWAGGAAPSLTVAGIDVIDCMTIDGGAIWYCFAAGIDMQ